MGGRVVQARAHHTCLGDMLVSNVLSALIAKQAAVLGCSSWIGRYLNGRAGVDSPSLRVAAGAQYAPSSTAGLHQPRAPPLQPGG